MQNQIFLELTKRFRSVHLSRELAGSGLDLVHLLQQH